MTFLQKLAAYSLGFKTDKDLPDIAMTAMEEGYDTASLRMLAGKSEKDSAFELREYFGLALKELGLSLPERKEALTRVVAFYANRIAEKEVDTYQGFDEMNAMINKTEFDCESLGLMSCYVDYITIWEEKSDGLDFHTAEGISKDQYIERTEEGIRRQLKEWLILNETK